MTPDQLAAPVAETAVPEYFHATGTKPAAHMLITGRGQAAPWSDPQGFYTVLTTTKARSRVAGYLGGKMRGEEWASEPAEVFLSSGGRGLLAGASTVRGLGLRGWGSGDQAYASYTCG